MTDYLTWPKMGNENALSCPRCVVLSYYEPWVRQ